VIGSEKTNYSLYIRTVTDNFLKMQESISNKLFMVVWDESMDIQWKKKIAIKKDINKVMNNNLMNVYNSNKALKYMKFNTLTFSAWKTKYKNL